MPASHGFRYVLAPSPSSHQSDSHTSDTGRVECGADLCISVGPKQVSGIPSLNQIPRFRCCMHDSQSDVTRMMAVPSCGLTLAVSIALHGTRPACASNPLLAICSLVVFLRSPDTVNGAGLSHSHYSLTPTFVLHPAILQLQPPLSCSHQVQDSYSPPHPPSQVT